ncbi:MAG: hypothetical protein ABJA62_11475, partial [Luteimonas sp.]
MSRIPFDARRALHATVAGAVVMLVMSGLVGCASRGMPSDVNRAPVDLQRFMGPWHVIAHVPY